MANTTGGVNAFSGAFAGFSNTTGAGNTFTGYASGGATQDGPNNTFTGYFSGVRNISGLLNSFYGSNSGEFNTTGSYNSFFGESSGANNVTGSQNIYIGSPGNPSSLQESNIIRIGDPNPADPAHQTDTYIAGIYPAAPGPSALFVCIDSSGKLGAQGAPCGGSSLRFKDQIANMDDSSSKLFQLRPVTFFYKPRYDDGTRQLQYGLIAEEVAKIYPEMAVYDKDGQPSAVKYQMLAPMLLNELQKEHAVVMTQQDQLQTQLRQIKVQRQEIDGLKLQLQQQNASLQERLQRLESYVATQMKTASDTARPATVSANGGVQ